ncbi:MAG TPA: hypothetical protein PLK31_25780 [Chloroflexota bacterium]|nr:hypothetical protein [Chloroflexota bacterium]
MNDENELEQWAERVQGMAAAFPYPPTPDTRGMVRQRLARRPSRRLAITPRLVWAVVAVTLLLALFCTGAFGCAPGTGGGTAHFPDWGHHYF